MIGDYYSHLQIREIFHIEFLRSFAKKFPPVSYALKGGVNMRLYFKSVRYSEDMDIDISSVDVVKLRDTVMKIITLDSFINGLKTFGIEEIRPPDIKKAKQTETTQRFKIHLITNAGEDLFTKIEFSRRQTSGNSVAESIPTGILRPYRMPPLIISHYDIQTTVMQKINALSSRKIVQARDIFDLYTLSTQSPPNIHAEISINPRILKTAAENAFSVEFRQFRDTVLSYLAEEDKIMYDNPDVWDEVRLKVSEFICQRLQ